MKQSLVIKNKKSFPCFSVLMTFMLLSSNYSYAAVTCDTSTCTNDGTLSSTGGVDQIGSGAWVFNNNYNNLAVTNTSAGTITSESTGIVVGGNNVVSIKNDGSITTTKNGSGSWHNAGIRTEGTITELINSGTIESWKFGVFVNGGLVNELTNTTTGVISSTTSAAIEDTGKIENLTNDGTISGYNTGIILEGNGSITNLVNNGTITATGATTQWFGSAIFLNSTAAQIGTITNNHLITTDKYGILNYGTIGTINNYGTIETASTGILSYGNIGEINNYGNITTTTLSNGQGIFLGSTSTVSSNTINNYGTISAQKSYGIDVNNNNTLIINNQGTIAANKQGVYVEKAASGAIINNTGTISGNTGSINIKSDNATIYNYGALMGNVSLGTSSSIYLLGQQSTVEGNISGGNASLLSIGSADIATAFDAAAVANVNVNKIVINDGSSLNLYDNSTWAASSTDEDAFLNDGTVTIYGDATLTSNVTNNGTILLNGHTSERYNTLTVDGNYVGDNGSLVLDTVLGNDSSITDKLVITGDASGTTHVTVNNIGGTGAKTLDGIEIIAVGGTSTSDAFIQHGRIVAGTYEYSLVQGNTSGSDTNSWYLTSNDYTLRPEVGSYIANLASANTLFNTTLHDRLGETQYTDWLTGEKLVTSMWLRSAVGQNKFAAGDGQISNKTNWSLVQLGGDIAQWSSNETNRLHLGVMAGFGRSNNDTDAKLSGYSAKGHIDGYSVGLYGTWYDNDADKSGLYVDSWVLWNHFNGKISGQDVDSEKYKLTGFTASLESGYTFKLGASAHYNYWLQPKAQLTYMGVDADSHTESNGTNVKGDADNWQSRLGLRLSTTTNNMLSSNAANAGQLFIETNWLHNTESFAVNMDGNSVSQDGARNVAEIKTGVEANILTNTNVWFNIGYQRGEHNYNNVGAMLGAKYSF